MDGKRRDEDQESSLMIAVVIPCYKVQKHILGVISSIGTEVSRIYVVDDCCPEKSGDLVKRECSDSRVTVLFHEVNRGVGGAVCTGYLEALKDGADVVVKIDGDGQMDPRLLMRFVSPIIDGLADYTKGNRFFNLDTLWQMPRIRLLGNSALSLINKVSSGYWNVIDPTNGYTAIHRHVLSMLPLQKLSDRYFFESDMLFRLGTLRAVVLDVPMDASYGDEVSNLNIKKVLIEFPPKYVAAFVKRLAYQYVFREFNIGTFCFVIGMALMLFGVIFGVHSWSVASAGRTSATSGTVMLAALPIILGFQMLLTALFFDINNYPKIPLARVFRHVNRRETV